MPVQIVNEDVEQYIRSLLTHHDNTVLLEMEKLAEEKNFPIVNRHVGVTLEILRGRLEHVEYSSWGRATDIPRTGLLEEVDRTPRYTVRMGTQKTRRPRKAS